MKKLSNPLFLVFALFFVGNAISCKKFLDTTPKDFLSPITYYDTEEQLNFALTGVYNILISADTYGNFMLGRMGLEGDEGWFRQGGAGGVERYGTSPTDPRITNLWKTFYNGINRANDLLANIDKPVIDETQRGVIKGETLFLRAYFYFVLVSNFGDIPLKLTPSVSPTETNFPRTSAKDVYEQIIKDMTESEGLVKSITDIGFSGRINKSAVQGILARVCLHMAGNPLNDVSKYAEARDWAKKVMSSGFHDLNPSYQQVFVNEAQDIYDIKECIWEIEFWGNSEGIYQTGGLVGSNLGIINSNNTVIGLAQGFIYAARWLFRSYEPGDIRRDLNIAPFKYNIVSSQTTTQEVPFAANSQLIRSVGKWRRVYELPGSIRNTFVTPQNFPLLRYSDVLLMFAETENQVNGPSDEVYEALNMVRRRAFGKPVHIPDPTADLQNLDKDSISSYIQTERARELCFENVRKRDICRWGIFLPRMQVGVSDFAAELPTNVGVNYYKNASQRDVVWPIPSWEMGLNKAMVQNPGW